MLRWLLLSSGMTGELLIPTLFIIGAIIASLLPSHRSGGGDGNVSIIIKKE